MAALGVGFYILSAHQFTPGASARPTRTWDELGMVTPNDHPRLLIFVHPHCPCTPAALRNLASVVGGRCRAVVYVAAPDAGACPNGQSAAGIPGVEVRSDPGGVMARRFGAKTSGQVLLYAAGGSLVFDGGITVGRGHEGINPALQALSDRLAESVTEPVSFPVFGCSLSE